MRSGMRNRARSPGGEVGRTDEGIWTMEKRYVEDAVSKKEAESIEATAMANARETAYDRPEKKNSPEARPHFPPIVSIIGTDLVGTIKPSMWCAATCGDVVVVYDKGFVMPEAWSLQPKTSVVSEPARFVFDDLKLVHVPHEFGSIRTFLIPNDSLKPGSRFVCPYEITNHPEKGVVVTPVTKDFRLVTKAAWEDHCSATGADASPNTRDLNPRQTKFFLQGKTVTLIGNLEDRVLVFEQGFKVESPIWYRRQEFFQFDMEKYGVVQCLHQGQMKTFLVPRIDSVTITNYQNGRYPLPLMELVQGKQGPMLRRVEDNYRVVSADQWKECKLGENGWLAAHSFDAGKEAFARGLELARELRSNLPDLKLVDRSQIAALLQSTLETIDQLPREKKWERRDRTAFGILVEHYAAGKADAIADVEKILPIETAGTPVSGDAQRAATPNTQHIPALERLLAETPEQMEARLKENLRRELSKGASGQENKEQVRPDNKAKCTDNARYRGGLENFAKDAKGRMGAVAIVIGAMVPILSSSASAAEPSHEPASWGKK